MRGRYGLILAGLGAVLLAPSLHGQGAQAAPPGAEEASPAMSDGITRGSPHRGGGLRLTADAPGGTLDPQINYTSEYIQLFVNMYDGLVTYRQADGTRGLEVVPDLAEALPEVSADGLVWAFRLREGIRFSNGAPVTVEDVAASLRRIYKVGSPTALSFYGNITGAKACLADPAHCRLEGVTTDPATRRITIRLDAPDGEFLQKLAFPHAVILPRDTPATESALTPLPGTGPYRITHYDPSRRMEIGRNPYFRVWNPAAQSEGYVDRIDYDFGLSDEAEVTAIEQGQYDSMLDAKPQDRLGELGSRFTDQVHLQPLLGLYYLALNVHEPPFDSLAVRQAINHAIDRHAMTILYGGSAIAEPLCQIVPHGIAGADIPCRFGRLSEAGQWRGPDIDRARALIRQSGHAGQSVTLVVPNQAVGLAMGVYLRNMLQSLGFQASVRPMTPATAEGYARNSDNHVQISLAYWYADYPSPSTFLDSLLGCDNARPHSDSATNASGFCHPGLQTLMTQAEHSLDAGQARALWEQAGTLAMEQSAVIPLIQMRYVDFVSKRLGNYHYSLLNHMLISQVWVQ
ncbi:MULTISPECIES: ABC transporter substrate-binding protein [Asaia]|uniref:ABC transporter substrate-binding protein n=1 Tax=Asaia TaxID=91914 RepID=UPI002552BC29|nr:ABC transporter substrate-binding protein [Asaia sp. HumB]MDL2171859.1 ABC transporter substrate-binding protein [Asaia sp. HumB]